MRGVILRAEPIGRNGPPEPRVLIAATRPGPSPSTLASRLEASERIAPLTQLLAAKTGAELPSERRTSRNTPATSVRLRHECAAFTPQGSRTLALESSTRGNGPTTKRLR